MKRKACGWLALPLCLAQAHPAAAVPTSWLPTLRLSLGGDWLLAPQSAGGLALDLNAGTAIGLEVRRDSPSMLLLLPEVGYSLRSLSDRSPTHLAAIGLGLGGGRFHLANGAYTPRFVIGATGNQTSFGFRHSVSGLFLSTTLCLELSHQMLSTSGMLSHELSLTLGVNFAALISMLVALATFD